LGSEWFGWYLHSTEQEFSNGLYECIYGIDLSPQIPLVTLPTLVLHGELDAIVPLQVSRWLASNLPNAHLQVIPDAGHAPTVTRPREVSEAINRFFSDQLLSE